MCCEACPATFHIECLGLKALPEGDWFCPTCRCAICDKSNYDRDGFSDETMLLCDVCEREFHVGCLNQSRGCALTCLPNGAWFCGRECEGIGRRLGAISQDGVHTFEIPSSVPGAPPVRTVTYRLLHGLQSGADTASNAELQRALDLMREGFTPIVDPRSGQDLVPKIVSAAAPEYGGFRTLCVYWGGEIATVASVRVFGRTAAELPLVATNAAFRGKGFCRITVRIIQSLLMDLGVQKLVLPSVESALPVWGALGFEACLGDDRRRLCNLGTLVFPGTAVLQKALTCESLTAWPTNGVAWLLKEPAKKR